eukprot:6195189-Pleurochrysis_carterae.AAC.1
MRRVLEKCKKLMNDKKINAGVIQVNKAIQAMEQSGRQMNMNIEEDRKNRHCGNLYSALYLNGGK